MILSDTEIAELQAATMMLNPFCDRTVVNGLSYGLSSCGYDVRIAESVLLVPSEFRLSVIEEHLMVPNTIAVFVKDKSSWARRGLSLYNTVIEPGWHGHLTIEMVNHSHNTIQISAGTPIAQLMFMRIEGRVARPYAGKYQGQPKRPVPAIEES
jgi:dCTP deaminase